MSTDFATQLTAMFDDAAAAITPRSDFGAVRSAAAAGPTITPAGAPPSGDAPFRRGALAAAAALVLLAGGAAAYQAIGGTDDTMSTSPDVTAAQIVESPTTTVEPDRATVPTAKDEAGDDPVEASAEPDIERTAFVAAIDVDRDPPVVEIHGTAPDGETVRVSSFAGTTTATASGGKWIARLELSGSMPDGPLLLVISFESSDDTLTLSIDAPATSDQDVGVGEADPEEPTPDEPTADEPTADEPTTDEPTTDEPTTDEPTADGPTTDEPKAEQPTPVEFTAKLGDARLDHEPPKVSLYGKARPGTHVSASSEFGEQVVVVGEQGAWEMWLRMPGLDPGETAHIRVLSSVDPSIKKFEITRPAPKPASVTFTAKRVEGVVEGDPIWQRFGGTGQPGSAVIATSDHGSADTVVGEGGEWTLKLWLDGVPAGKKVVVLVSNPASGITKEFVIETPPAAPTVAFSANAAFVECNSNPPYNEYWGTAQPGTTVKIVSPYGSAERTAGPGGGWDARVEFPDAPFGETFIVKVKSVATGEYLEFPMKRVTGG